LYKIRTIIIIIICVMGNDRHDTIMTVTSEAVTLLSPVSPVVVWSCGALWCPY